MATSTGGGNRYLVLTAMIFAVAMTFIDQTIVSIAIPKIQSELHLSATGVQWVVNGYLIALAALFALGGRLSDIAGHRRMCVIGIVVFAGASALCGLTPATGVAEAWIVGFRVLQGAGGAIMYPAALAIVVNNFPLRERGKALALFFGIAGGLTAVGPILGGYLTQWTWRAIFWVNIPVAVIALVLIAVSRPTTLHRAARLDYRGAVLIAAGVGLSVFGFQQSVLWGWSNGGTWACIVVGLILLLLFVLWELRAPSPLLEVRIFRVRAFFVENAVLLISMMVFIPVFFFASEYAQLALGKTAAEAGLYLLYFFLGFVVAAQIGGRMLDRIGAKRPVVLGCAIAAVGFGLWASKVVQLNFSNQTWAVVVTGAGMGMMLGPANTDAINRASRLSYGEATGITQTVRNYGASLGLAVLGTVLVTVERSHLTDSLRRLGIPGAGSLARRISEARSAPPGSSSSPAFQLARTAARLSFASATRVVLYCMCAVMAVAAVVALIGLEPGVQASLGSEDGGGGGHGEHAPDDRAGDGREGRWAPAPPPTTQDRVGGGGAP